MNKTVTIILPDVFGVTQDLQSLASHIAHEWSIVDAYECAAVAPPEQDADDQQAYARFQQHIGLDAYSEMLHEKLLATDAAVRVVGFSVGAAAAWRVASRIHHQHVHGAVCFYGNQIRKMVELKPTWPTHCVFPRHEPHFDVATLGHQIQGAANVDVEWVDYAHGFMNRRSNGYSPQGRSEFAKRLADEHSFPNRNADADRR